MLGDRRFRLSACCQVALLAAPLLFAGCQKQSAGKPVHAVRGQVLFNGAPVKDCFVVFYPQDDANDLERPQGYTDEAGFFEVTARRNEKGAAEGIYTVVLLWRDKNPDPEGDGKWKGPNKLPAKYGSPASSDLRVEVKPGNNELKPFDIR